MQFKSFYTYDELTRFLQDAQAGAPDLVRMTSIAKTPEGRDVWCVEVAAARDELAVDVRPGLLIQGNLHAIEYAGSMQALYILETLLQGYPGDPQIRRLLEEHVVYIVPRVAVDGAEYGLRTLDRVRSRRVEVLQKNVSTPQDVNGDGRILTMRWISQTGRYKAWNDDPRLLVPRQPGDTEGPFFHMTVEGIIHDWDGQTVAASRAGNDFNRNFPANWAPFPGRIGQGQYPLSEPETRGVADFILARPNIVSVLDFHTGNPAIFYPAAGIAEAGADPQDATLIARLGRLGEELTGFPLLSGYEEAKTGKKTERLPGSFIEWVYQQTGAVAYIVEMGLFYNSLGVEFGAWFDSPYEREVRPGAALLAWHDAHPDEQLFFDWEPFDHPQIGPVEIGGWNWPLWSNPPLHEMEEICRRGAAFAFQLAEHRPQLQLAVHADKLDQGIHKVTVDLRNVGALPTHITNQGRKMHPLDGVQVRVLGPTDAEWIIGAPEVDIGHLAARDGARRLEWVIRSAADEIVVEARSGRGLLSRGRAPLPK